MNTEYDDEQDLDRALNQALQQLPKEVRPAADLWPGLQTRLKQTPQQHPRLPAWPFAAAAVLAALWLTPWPQPAPEVPPVTLETETVSPSVENSLVQTYEQQKAQQLAGLRFTAGPMGDWQEQLSAWDDAVLQVRFALSFYPDEPQLLSQLDMLYRQQLSYLQQVALAETSVPNAYY